jgi:hypothetical protein
MKTTRNHDGQTQREQLDSEQLSVDERKLVERINERRAARHLAQPTLILRLTSTPLIWW